MSEDLQQTMYAISQAAYSQVQQESQNTGSESNAGADNASDSSNSGSDDDVIDAEYTKE